MKPILQRRKRMMVQLEYIRASSCAKKSKNNSRSVNVNANKKLQARQLEVPEELLEPVALKVVAGRRQGVVQVPRQKMRNNL